MHSQTCYATLFIGGHDSRVKDGKLCIECSFGVCVRDGWVVVNQLVIRNANAKTQRLCVRFAKVD